MDLSVIAIHPVVVWAQQPGSGQPSEAPNPASGGVGSGNAGGAPGPDRYRDTYEPTSVPGNDGEAGTQPATGAPERGMPAGGKEPREAGESGTTPTTERPKPRGVPKGGPGSMELTPDEKALVEDLKTADAAVRTHEMAHIMAGGQYIIRRANFAFVLGPDGKLYAVGGEVQIDTSEVPDDPEATIRKAQAVRRAALAPGNPSPQDLRVAAEATRMEFEARMELVRQRAEEALEQAEEYNRDGETITLEPEPFLLNLFA